MASLYRLIPVEMDADFRVCGSKLSTDWGSARFMKWSRVAIVLFVLLVLSGMMYSGYRLAAHVAWMMRSKPPINRPVVTAPPTNNPPINTENQRNVANNEKRSAAQNDAVPVVPRVTKKIEKPRPQ